MVIIGLFNTGGYGFGYGKTKKDAIDYILKKIKNDKLNCFVRAFVEYPRLHYIVSSEQHISSSELLNLEFYAGMKAGNKLLKTFRQFLRNGKV